MGKALRVLQIDRGTSFGCEPFSFVLSFPSSFLLHSYVYLALCCTLLCCGSRFSFICCYLYAGRLLSTIFILKAAIEKQANMTTMAPVNASRVKLQKNMLCPECIVKMYHFTFHTELQWEYRPWQGNVSHKLTYFIGCLTSQHVCMFTEHLSESNMWQMMSTYLTFPVLACKKSHQHSRQLLSLKS